MAQIVIKHRLDKFGLKNHLISDFAFDEMTFLYSKEPIYNLKGEKVSKSYFDKESNKEAVRIEYAKIFDTYNGIENVFIGVEKHILFLDWVGNVAYKKKMQPYYFELIPVYDLVNTETIVGYSSLKQREILKAERYKADVYMQSHNPALYSLLFSNYESLYNKYLATGDSTDLIDALNNETNTDILTLLNKLVVEIDADINVKELIILNLQ